MGGTALQDEFTLPIPAEVLAKFGTENLRKLVGEDGLIAVNDTTEARIRRTDNTKYVLTIKQQTEDVASRLELEFPVEKNAAEQIMRQCPQRIEKTRHVIAKDGNTWEVDEYSGANAGLVIAEVEAAMRPAVTPAWIGEEVTGEEKYSNRLLAETPYTQNAANSALRL